MNKMGEENFMSTKVMLVDDHALIREGIKQLLEFDGSIDVIEQASDGAECLEKLQHVHRPGNSEQNPDSNYRAGIRHLHPHRVGGGNPPGTGHPENNRGSDCREFTSNASAGRALLPAGGSDFHFGELSYF